MSDQRKELAETADRFCARKPNHMPPDFAVIIPHYNDAIRLRRCLAALSSGGTPGAEVLVVDNGSSEPLDAIKAEFPTVRFVNEHQKGAALARNRGVRESTAEQIFFLDADCVPAPDWFSVATGAAGRADIIGGAIDVFDETSPPRTGAEAFETIFAFNYRDYINNKGFSVTANLLTSRRVFDAVGPFIDGMSEDEEWCQRAGAKGYRITLEEGLRVAHPTRSDWPALKRKWRRITREMFALHCARHHGSTGRLSWFLRALAMPPSALVHVPKVLFSAKLDRPSEKFRGVATLVRLRCLRSYWMLRQSLGLPI
jgi:glycosyltransferase involved in cell wall biosynthesis